MRVVNPDDEFIDDSEFTVEQIKAYCKEQGWYSYANVPTAIAEMRAARKDVR